MRRACGIDQRYNRRGYDDCRRQRRSGAHGGTGDHDGHGLRRPLRGQRLFAANHHGQDDEIQPDQHVLVAFTARRRPPRPTARRTPAPGPVHHATPLLVGVRFHHHLGHVQQRLRGTRSAAATPVLRTDYARTGSEPPLVRGPDHVDA